MGVQVFTISTDSKFVHMKWDEFELCKLIDGGFPFPMLSDVMGNVGKPYGVYDDDSGLYLRGTIIIDPEGIVQLISVNVPPLGRDAGEIVREFRALQESTATGKVAPAGWKPGEDLLEPKPENAGNVWKTYKSRKK